MRIGNGDLLTSNIVGDFLLFQLLALTKKLDGYYGKLRNAEITAMRQHGGFGERLEVRKVVKSKNQRLVSKMENRTSIVSGAKETVRKTFCENGERSFGM